MKKVKKRDGTLVAFDKEKIISAISRAFEACGEANPLLSRMIADAAMSILKTKLEGRQIPEIENIQDAIEEALILRGHEKAAKAYILYRQKRAEIRELKKSLGVVDDLKLSLNALSVLKKRYLQKDGDGNVIETPSQMFRRVAKTIAKVDSRYEKKSKLKETEEKFYEVLANLEFLPNSPTLMNAGTKLGQLSACFVLPLEDSLESIFNSIKDMALIHQSGGGTGFSFSKLRPKGDVVKSTLGVSSGPVSFMKIFDSATEVIKQGGRRRGANMGILSVYHPDILEFISSKNKDGVLNNFNISVAVDDKFMKAVEEDKEYDVIHPKTLKPVRTLRAKSVFDLMVTMAWRGGDPGIVYIDEINKHNPTPKLGTIEATNPCGEQPLLPYESCNLGSINLTKMLGQNNLDWDKLRETVQTAVHFLDNVIDANHYPLPEIEKITKANRKIGLGIMGLADILIKLGIPYNSDRALDLAIRITRFINDEARRKSEELGKKRGSFPNFKNSNLKNKYRHMRNATATTIAPTGTISIIAGVTSGIEPLFAVVFMRNIMEGTSLLEINLEFEATLRRKDLFSEGLIMEIARTGSIQNLKDLPDEIKKVFVTALDISYDWHVKMQAACQKFVDNAVSKTVNLPFDATAEDIRNVFLLAYKLKCKGTTVYRYGSKKDQALTLGSIGKEMPEERSIVSAKSEFSGGCPSVDCHF